MAALQLERDGYSTICPTKGETRVEAITSLKDLDHAGIELNQKVSWAEDHASTTL